jgi:hypothetical protein
VIAVPRKNINASLQEPGCETFIMTSKKAETQYPGFLWNMVIAGSAAVAYGRSLYQTILRENSGAADERAGIAIFRRTVTITNRKQHENTF